MGGTRTWKTRAMAWIAVVPTALLPLLALIAPGHYVLVERVAPAQTSIWDPDAQGIGVGGRRTFTAVAWAKAWNGIALR